MTGTSRHCQILDQARASQVAVLDLIRDLGVADYGTGIRATAPLCVNEKSEEAYLVPAKF